MSRANEVEPSLMETTYELHTERPSATAWTQTSDPLAVRQDYSPCSNVSPMLQQTSIELKFILLLLLNIL